MIFGIHFKVQGEEGIWWGMDKARSLFVLNSGHICVYCVFLFPLIDALDVSHACHTCFGSALAIVVATPGAEPDVGCTRYLSCKNLWYHRDAQTTLTVWGSWHSLGPPVLMLDNSEVHLPWWFREVLVGPPVEWIWQHTLRWVFSPFLLHSFWSLSPIP